MACLAQEIPLPSVVGFVGASHGDHGKPVANSAAVTGHVSVLFEQHKMLLPTYDVFDESRCFEPAESQSTFALRREELASQILQIQANVARK